MLQFGATVPRSKTSVDWGWASGRRLPIAPPHQAGGRRRREENR